MFDTVRCSFDLGASFHNRELQTKDLECFMAEYWLSPAGHLFNIDYSGTQDFEEDPNSPLGLVSVSNGNRGRVRIYPITKTIEVYPAKWNAHYVPYPRLYLHFREGVLEYVSKPESNRL
jgi:hypothetical protein